MIFYTALDKRGHTQLRGTQADARAVNRDFEQIDIPTDKAGLMAFVQDLYSQINVLQDQIGEGGLHLDPAPLDSRQYAPPFQVPPSAVEEAIPSDDGDKFDARILEEQVDALGMLGHEALDRFDGWTAATGISAAFARGVALLNVIASDQHQLAKLFLRDRLKKRRRFGS